MALVILLLVLGILIWIYSYARNSKFRDFAKKVGGPRGLPFIGMLHRMLSQRDLLYDLPQFPSKDKSAFLWAVHKPIFYTFDPAIIEQIVTSPNCINKSELYDLIDQEMGSGIMTSKSPIWDKHRKILNTCFTHKNLLSFIPIFNKESNEVSRKFDSLVGCGEQDLWTLLQNFALRSSYSTTVGEDIANTPEKGLTLISHITWYLHTVFERSSSFSWRSNIAFRFHKSHKAYHDSKNFVHSFVRNILKKRLADTEAQPLDEIKKVHQNESSDIVKPPCVFVDLAVDIHRKNILSWDEVCNEAYVVIAAAFETSATTLSNILMFLAMHPEYQQKVFEEIVSVFPEENFDVAFENLADLVYMDMFIDETLRIAPSVPLISRVVSRETDIGNNILMPEGILVIMDIFNLHRSEKLWGPNATKFDPDNFLLKRQGERHAYSFMPFSKGPRNCIGWRYARIFLKVALSKIVRKYRFTTSFRYEDLRCVHHLSLRYEVTPKLEIHRR